MLYQLPFNFVVKVKQVRKKLQQALHDTPNPNYNLQIYFLSAQCPIGYVGEG